MYRLLYRNALAHLDAETAHDAAVRLMRLAGALPQGRALLRAFFAPRVEPAQAITAFGLRFTHPLGLAGGFDKRGECLPALAALGFSHVEVGTITPQAQPGNARPRVFRLVEDAALINRMGFPSDGIVSAVENLRAFRRRFPVYPLAISLGKNKNTPLIDAHRDYTAVLEALYPYGDFFTVNVSSPNTPELRQLQTAAYLNDLLTALRTQIDAQPQAKPLLIKIAPDLTWVEIDTVLDLALRHGMAGIVATNTTLVRDGLRSATQRESGGLSGRPLRERADVIIRYIVGQTGGRLPVIGVGGVFDADDLKAKLDAGAILVQAYTGFIYQGPAFVRRCVGGSP